MQSGQEFKNQIDSFKKNINENVNCKDGKQYFKLVDNVDIYACATRNYIKNCKGDISFDESLKLLEQANKFESLSQVSNELKSVDSKYPSIGIGTSHTVEGLPKLVEHIQNSYNNMNSQEKEAFHKDFSNAVLNSYYQNLNKYAKWSKANDISNAFFDTVSLKEEYIPAKDSYYSILSSPERTLTNRIYDKEIDALLEDENVKNDPELVNALNKSKEMLVGAYDIGIGENFGRDSFDIFEKKYEEYAINNNIAPLTNQNAGTILNDLENRESFIKNNKINQKVNFDNIQKLQELSDYAYKNGIITEGNCSVSIYVENVGKQLIEAIKQKNPENIKKLSSELSEKIDIGKNYVNQLKELNQSGLIDSNCNDSRADTYPGIFRNDIIGTSLANQFGGLNKLAKNNNMTITELISDPEKAVDKIVDYQIKTCALNSSFTKQDPFEGVFSVLNEKQSLDDIVISDLCTETQIPFQVDLIRLPSALCTSFNCQDPYAMYNNLNIPCRFIPSIMGDNATMLQENYLNKFNEKGVPLVQTDLFPKMALLGNDFNIFKHSSINDQLIDPITGETQKAFNIIQYAKENFSPEEIIDKFKNSIELGKDEKYVDKQITINNCLDSFKDVATKSFKEITKSNSKTIDKYFNALLNDQKVSTVQMNTINSLVQVSKDIKEVEQTKDIKASIESLSKMQKTYYSHNGLSRLFNSSLREQKKALNDLKTSLCEKGIDRKELDKAIKLVNGKDRLKEQKLNVIYTRENQKLVPEKVSVKADEPIQKEQIYDLAKQELVREQVKNQIIMPEKTNVVKKQEEPQKVAEKQIDKRGD